MSIRLWGLILLLGRKLYSSTKAVSTIDTERTTISALFTAHLTNHISHPLYCRIEKGRIRGTPEFLVCPHQPRYRLPGPCKMGTKDSCRMGCKFLPFVIEPSIVTNTYRTVLRSTLLPRIGLMANVATWLESHHKLNSHTRHLMWSQNRWETGRGFGIWQL